MDSLFVSASNCLSRATLLTAKLHPPSGQSGPVCTETCSVFPGKASLAADVGFSETMWAGRFLAPEFCAALQFPQCNFVPSSKRSKGETESLLSPFPTQEASQRHLSYSEACADVSHPWFPSRKKELFGFFEGFFNMLSDRDMSNCFPFPSSPYHMPHLSFPLSFPLR